MLNFERMKKAQFSWTVIIIIVLVVILLMLLMEGRISEMLKGQTNRNLCKSSVFEHSVARMKIIDLVSDINCPTQEITVKGDENEMKGQMAKAMFTCWDQFG